MKTFEIKLPIKRKKAVLILKDLSDSKSNSRKFEGVVTMDSFSLKRYYSFPTKGLKPQIDGLLEESENGTTITVRATVNKHDMFFLIISSIIVCAASLFILSRVFTSIIETIVMLAVFFMFLSIVVFLNVIIFKAKARELIKILE